MTNFHGSVGGDACSEFTENIILLALKLLNLHNSRPIISQLPVAYVCLLPANRSQRQILLLSLHQHENVPL